MKTVKEYADGLWAGRLDSAQRYFKSWEDKYKCKTLEEYHRGFHWKSNEGEYPEAYVLNMIYTTLEIKLAQYSFANINFRVRPRPSNSDEDLEFAIHSAQLKEDCLNTLVSDPNGKFNEEIEAALRDSFFRFGLMETGYSAEWLTNPNAGKPLYRADIDNGAASDKPIIERQPDRIPVTELIYFKRINPARFRVGGIEGRYLGECNWVGYYDFYYAEDIKSSKSLQNTDKINTVSHRTSEFDSEDAYTQEFQELAKKGDLLKIWKIWDLRAKQFLLYDPTNEVILYNNPFKRLPLFDLRWTPDVKGYYPIPPVFHWLSPQDEINESRQQMRSYRRRFNRQYQVVSDFIDPEELDKFEEAKDGAIIKVKRDDAIKPIADAPLNAVNSEAMVVGKGDLILISGTSSEAMGQGDRITATQTMEISKRFAVRENRETIKVANWIVKVGREALMLAQEKMVIGLWVKSTQNPGESIMGTVQENPSWQYVLAGQLEDKVDFDVAVELVSMSPIANDQEKQKFIEFLTLVKSFPEISLSPMLIREAAYRVGYRNEKIIKEMQATSILSSLGQMAASQNGPNPTQNKGNQIAQGKIAAMTPPNIEQTRQQIDNQNFIQ